MLDRTFFVSMFVITLAACAKTESAPSSGASTSETPTATTATAAPSASVQAIASATASGAASAIAAPTTTGTTSASAGATAKTAPSASAASSAGSAAECGTKPQPDCPLQAWMKANTNPPVAANDLPALALALDKVAAFAPPGYANWASISKDGAKAARANDMTAAKASCRTCHDQYKQKYKTEMRARKI